jgi:microcystin degradation protein MlrC
VKRLAVARLWHEGNSFSPVPTPVAAFQAREWIEGDAARAFYRDTATEMGAAVAFADAVRDWDVEFLRCAAAPPGGPVPQADYLAIRDEILAGFGRGPWDAVYLSLHGALITDADPAPELDLLRAVRQRIGRTPLAVSFDLHANIGAEHVGLIDLAAGYKTYPHVDMAQTAGKLLRQLVALGEGRLEPKGAIVKLPLILPSFNMRTTDGPMADVAALARAVEAEPGILDATVFGGFAYGDSPHAGAAAMVFADRDSKRAGLIAADLARTLEERADRFFIRLPEPAAALSVAAAEGPGTVALLDPADNPLSGGIGDTPGLLHALLDARPAVPALFAFFWDPDLVAQAHREGPGARLRVRLGARLTDRFGPPVEGEATVLKLTDGHFRNRGPMERNLPVALGRTALLEVAGVRIIVTETCQTPNDPGYFDLHGIDLAAVRLLCVKAKNHFRAAFAPLCRRIIDVDLPGPAALDLRRLPYRHLPPGVRRSAL